ncbi:MAG: Fur family transcriptional regulator [Cyanobacteria bacterium J06627_8]
MESTQVNRKPVRSLDDALEKCKALGMRLSKQRRYILELLWQTDEHLSAREIYDRLNRQGRDIGHTSVYQNLEALSNQNIIECLERSDGRLYGNISDSHSHVYCLDADQILDIHIQLPADVIQQVEAATGITITDYQVNFYGHRKPSDNAPEE